jgi:hypothetical protein
MKELLGPLIGLFVGVSLILFRKRTASLIEKAYKRLPKYEDGVRAFDVKFEVRPMLVLVLGLIIGIFSVMSFFRM